MKREEIPSDIDDTKQSNVFVVNVKGYSGIAIRPNWTSATTNRELVQNVEIMNFLLRNSIKV